MNYISIKDAKFISLLELCTSFSKNKIKKFLKTFRCINKDVTNFLHNNAIKFEEKGLARTYLWYIVNPLKVIAYFTIALKAIYIDDKVIESIKDISKEDFENILNDILKGYSLKNHNKQIPVYLIGQVGKDPNVEKLNGYLIKIALKYIHEASKIVGGKIVVLDVIKNNQYKKLINYYKGLGFKELYEFSSSNQNLIRLYYKLP